MVLRHAQVSKRPLRFFVGFGALLLGCTRTTNDPKPVPSAAPSVEAPKEIPAKAHCDVKDALAFCSEYSGTVAPSLKESCELNHGTYGDGPCGTVGVVGTCGLEEGERKRYYAAVVVAAGAKGKAFTAVSAKADCTAKPLAGTFVAPAGGN